MNPESRDALALCRRCLHPRKSHYGVGGAPCETCGCAAFGEDRRKHNLLSAEGLPLPDAAGIALLKDAERALAHSNDYGILRALLRRCADYIRAKAGA